MADVFSFTFTPTHFSSFFLSLITKIIKVVEATLLDVESFQL